jgi:quinol monooxygenase YgiN
MSSRLGIVPRTAAHLFEFRTATFEVPASSRDEVIASARELERASRCLPGTRLFAVLRDRDRDGRFLCTAVFDDDDAERTFFALSEAHRFAAVLLAVGVRIEPHAWEAVVGV